MGHIIQAECSTKLQPGTAESRVRKLKKKKKHRKRRAKSSAHPERVEPETLVPFSLTLFSSLFTPESSLNWSSSSSSSSGGCREITVPSESVMPGPTTTCKYVQHILMKKYRLLPHPATSREDNSSRQAIPRESNKCNYRYQHC